MDSLKYSIVIPVYNAEKSLEHLHATITSYFAGKYSFEIIYVDDQSADNSWEILNNIKSKSTNQNISLIRLSKNFGQHATTLCGFHHSKGDFIITMDDDLEVHPSEIQKLIDEQSIKNNDLVYADYEKRNTSLLRKFLSATYKLFSKIEGKNKGKGSSYRLIKKSLAKQIAGNHSNFVFIDELCLWYTNKIAFVKVEANKESFHQKRYSLFQLISIASNVITFSSTRPLKFITHLGLLLSGSNFIIGIYFLVKKFFFKIEVAGYTSLIVSILFSTGIIIFCLGIIAQYISQTLKGINNAPAYNIDEIKC